MKKFKVSYVGRDARFPSGLGVASVIVIEDEPTVTLDRRQDVYAKIENGGGFESADEKTWIAPGNVLDVEEVE